MEVWIGLTVIVTIALIILAIKFSNLKREYEIDSHDRKNMIELEIEKKTHEMQLAHQAEMQEINSTIEKNKLEQAETLRITIIEERKKARESSRHVLKGKISEQMSPHLPEFYSKYEPSDARFLGSPIDYMVFKNMSKYDGKTKVGEIPIEIVLIEIKSAKKTGLTVKERAIKLAVEEGRVSFDIIRHDMEPPKEIEPQEEIGKMQELVENLEPQKELETEKPPIEEQTEKEEFD